MSDRSQVAASGLEDIPCIVNPVLTKFAAGIVCYGGAGRRQ